MPARWRVMSALAEQAARFPELMPITLDESGLQARDAALSHAIYDAVMRRWLTIEAIVSRFLTRPINSLDAPVTAALFAGTAQLVFLDRVPDHAALNESVQWAKVEAGDRAGGLVNAVLRRVIELRGGPGRRVHVDRWSGERNRIPLADGRALEVGQEVLPREELSALAVAYSVPRELLERWSARLGAEAARSIAAYAAGEAPTVINASHADATGIVAAGAEAGVTLQAHGMAGFFVAEAPRAVLAAWLGSRRDVWVQDPASSQAISTLRSCGISGRLIVDLCAGQGTKTRQLAAVFPEATIIATDSDHDRLSELARVFRGDSRVEVLALDSAKRRAAGAADLVLLDVPCSNTGVLARRVEARYRALGPSMERLIRLQREIATDGRRLLAPGGVLVYSTCSLERDEDEDQVDWMCGSLGYSRIREDVLIRPVGAVSGVNTLATDGAFSAAIRASG